MGLIFRIYDHLLPQCFLPTVTLCGNYCVDALESAMSTCLIYLESLDEFDKEVCLSNVNQVSKKLLKKQSTSRF